MIEKEENADIAKRIKELRESLGLSQKTLGTLVGVTDAAVTNWESGSRFPRGKYLRKLAVALKVSEGYILNGPNSQNEEKNLSKAELIGLISIDLPSLKDDQLESILRIIDSNLGRTTRPVKIKKSNI